MKKHSPVERMRGRGKVREAKPIYWGVLILFGILAVLAVIGGLVALVLNSMSPTAFSMFGVELSTGHVGVALIVVGLVTAYFTFRAVMKSMEKISDQKDD